MAALNSIAIAREHVRCTDGRRLDRHRVNGPQLRVTYQAREYVIELVNLSAGGAMIAGSLRPNLTDRVDLRFDACTSIECLVRWLKDGRIGLQFAPATQLTCTIEQQIELLREVVAQGSDPTVPATLEPGPEDRLSGRHPLVWFGRLLYGSSEWTARLRNVSASGALIECAAHLSPGDEIVLDLGSAGSPSAQVTWTVGDHLGLRFHQPFDMQSLARAEPLPAGSTWLRPAYLDNKLFDDDQWEQNWRHMSIEDLREELEGFLKR